MPANRPQQTRSTLPAEPETKTRDPWGSLWRWASGGGVSGSTAAVDGTGDIWQRLSKFTLALIVLAALGCCLVLFKPQLEKRELLRRDVLALSEHYEQIRGRADGLHQELFWLRGDLNYLEGVARDRLDLQKEGEQIIRVVRPGTGSEG